MTYFGKTTTFQSLALIYQKPNKEVSNLNNAWVDFADWVKVIKADGASLKIIYFSEDLDFFWNATVY